MPGRVVTWACQPDTRREKFVGDDVVVKPGDTSATLGHFVGFVSVRMTCWRVEYILTRGWSS